MSRYEREEPLMKLCGFSREDLGMIMAKEKGEVDKLKLHDEKNSRSSKMKASFKMHFTQLSNKYLVNGVICCYTTS
jgi:hypothetical protein